MSSAPLTKTRSSAKNTASCLKSSLFICSITCHKETLHVEHCHRLLTAKSANTCCGERGRLVRTSRIVGCRGHAAHIPTMSPLHQAGAKLELRCCREGGGLKSVKVLKIEEGNPDGHTIDSDGNIWEALASSNMVICYNPDSGAIPYYKLASTC